MKIKNYRVNRGYFVSSRDGKIYNETRSFKFDY